MPSHLHVHSIYSTSDAMIKPKDLAKRVKELGLSAACITDHGNLRAAPSLWKACQEEKVKCVLGIEAYLAPESRHKKEKIEGKPNSYHIVLLAKNRNGWNNLVKLSSIAELEGFYYKPRIDWELLDSELGDDLIVLSACMQGEIPKALSVPEGEEPDLDEILANAMHITDKYINRWRDDFYIEIQAHAVEGQKELNNILCSIARRKKQAIVATCDAHFLSKDDYEAHQALIALQRGSTIPKMRAKGDYYGPWFYIQTPEEMVKYLPEDYAYDAIATTDTIVGKIEDYKIGLNPKKFYLVHYKE